MCLLFSLYECRMLQREQVAGWTKQGNEAQQVHGSASISGYPLHPLWRRIFPLGSNPHHLFFNPYTGAITYKVVNGIARTKRGTCFAAASERGCIPTQDGLQSLSYSFSPVSEHVLFV